MCVKKLSFFLISPLFNLASIEVSQVIPIRVMGKEGGSLKSKRSSSPRSLNPGKTESCPPLQLRQHGGYKQLTCSFFLFQIPLFIQTSCPNQSPLTAPACTGRLLSPHLKIHIHTTKKEVTPQTRTLSSFNLCVQRNIWIRRLEMAQTIFFLSSTRCPDRLHM